MKSQAKILEERKLLRWKHFEMIEQDVEYDGKTMCHFNLRNPGAAVVIPITQEGQLILLRQYRHSVGKELLEFPAGGLDKNEEPLACAKRELEEETGLLASEWQELGNFYPTPGFCDEIQYGFVAKGLSEGKLNRDENEFIEVEKMTISEFKHSVQSGAVEDSKSMALFCRALLMGLFE